MPLVKTTIDLADDLAVRAKQLARKQGVTFRVIVEQALRQKLDSEGARQSYKLPDKSVKGKGLQAGFQEQPWSAIREAAYDPKYQ